jgi:phage-related protein
MHRYREIILYETESGRSPVQQFISKIRGRVDQAKIAKVFEAIEHIQVVPSLFLKKLPHDIWEVRVRSYRFLGFYDRPDRLVLVHAFMKQSQKTPRRDIEVAVDRCRTYSGERELPL